MISLLGSSWPCARVSLLLRSKGLEAFVDCFIYLIGYYNYDKDIFLISMHQLYIAACYEVFVEIVRRITTGQFAQKGLPSEDVSPQECVGIL